MLEIVDGREQSTPVHIPRPRPVPPVGHPEEDVRRIVAAVRARGDAGLVEVARADGIRMDVDALRVAPATIDKAGSLVPPELVDALEVMAARLRDASERQMVRGWTDRRPGESIGELVRPLRRVGIVASSPSSVVAAAVPARVAGVEGRALAARPSGSGEVAEPVLAACSIAGVDEVYALDGAAAVAALAYGTETVRPVDKVVGGGDLHVRLAKQLVATWVATDIRVDRAELMVIADDGPSPRVIAADLVAHAEHGAGGSHVLVTWIPEVAERVISALDFEVATHERIEDVENALIEGGVAVLVRDVAHALDTANAFAPAQLQLAFSDASRAVDSVVNAGAVFVGEMTAAGAGDYLSAGRGLSPGGGLARSSSPLSVRDFVKSSPVWTLERSALERLAPHVDALAEAEGCPAHARAVAMRLDPRAGRGPALATE